MTTTIKVIRALKDEDKLAPQAKVIHKTIVGKVGVAHPIDRDALIKELEANAGGKDATLDLKTRQGAARILSYYTPKLVTAGLISVEKTAAEKPAKAPAATKPAKAA